MGIKLRKIKDDEEFLRQISRPVDFSDESYISVAKKLEKYTLERRIVYAMASVQINYPVRMVYVKRFDQSFDPRENVISKALFLINPVVISKTGETIGWEACASCLEYNGLVRRPYKIEVEYLNLNGEKQNQIFEGWEATVISHEFDHLDGILHLDRAKEVVWVERDKDGVRINQFMAPYKIIRKDGEFEYEPLKKFKIDHDELMKKVEEFERAKKEREEASK